MYPHGREKCEVCCAVHDTDRTMFAIQALIMQGVYRTDCGESSTSTFSLTAPTGPIKKPVQLQVRRCAENVRMRRSARKSPRWTPEQRRGKSFGTNYGTLARKIRHNFCDS